MDIVDLRSDTVTQPTPAMREAMAKAEVGDDVMGEDPTLLRLQEMSAELMGKEAGLFVPSGTMGNLAAMLAHCGRGDEIIMGNQGHTFLFEAGGISALGGVFPSLLPNQPDGTLRLEDIQGALRDPHNPHHPLSRLVVLENTHNRCGGACLTPEYTRSVADMAHANGLLLHIDGARIFNAAAALGVSTRDLAGPADSVTFCLSKGLCAPVGSVLCGSKEFIERALRARKMLGGGMRQAGVLAAAGIVALEQVAPRLGEDHRRACALAQGLGKVPGLTLDAGLPQTNMVYATLDDSVKANAAEVAGQLAARYGVKVGVVAKRRFRMVTHYWITDEGVARTVDGFRQVL